MRFGERSGLGVRGGARLGVVAVALAVVVAPFRGQCLHLLQQVPVAGSRAEGLLRELLDAGSQVVYGQQGLDWLKQR